MTTQSTLKPISEHGPCYICGTQNPHGVGLTWYAREDGSIFSEFMLTVKQQGPPGHVHGGASAAVLDEVIGVAIWRAGYNVAVVNMDINYRQAIPIDSTVTVEARMTGKEGRKFFGTGEIYLPDGSVAVSCTGIYVEAPHLFEESRYRE
ncbi:MAG: PaaI family thioesterase [Anaerolineales bacterium]|uniref:Acyl-coenzyme A thioesterase THEM4 n=1 Tax=Candidatus Desulfolinea nitratireducens TaxID=2841698 RepID=A0A8J6TIK0_9CHLR|nr:PaaI family thioesterase [Candidatus Desulfolinea nitratireducens]MBL6959968.1 PaaI family thioesterase [Anaerolineales bacterium]